MIRTCLLFFLATINVIHTQNSIGLRALATLRGLTLGSEAPVPYLRGDADMGQYISTLKQNIDLIIPANICNLIKSFILNTIKINELISVA